MTKHHFQQQLFATQAQRFNLPDAHIEYWPEFIEPVSAAALFDTLRTQTAWRQEQISLYGKQHKVPRLSSWVADAGLNYSYSNMTMQPLAWSEILLGIRENLTQGCRHNFNSVLLNYYRDGQDSNGWHADNESELGINPVIASISLGGDRDFDCRHKSDKNLRKRFTLGNGSLLIMSGAMQHHWQHCIPKRAHAAARINLTFRTILS